MEEAVEIFKKIYSVEDIDQRTKAELGSLLATISMDAGQYDEARRYIAAAEEVGTSLPMMWVSKGLVTIVEVENAASDEEANAILNETLSYFDKAISIQSDSTMAHYWKGRILMLSGNNDMAQESFMKAKESVETDITLMEDERSVMREEIDRFASETDKTSYYLRFLINEAHAENVKWKGSSYSGFLAAVRSESRPGHVFTVSGNTAYCNNGWSLTWVPTCTAKCGSCNKSCGGGTKSCTRSDCSKYNASCNTNPCPVNGKCGSGEKTDYPYTTNSVSGLCEKGTASPSSVSFPSGKYGADSRVTWSCNGKHGGSNASCAAERLRPKVDCKNHAMTSAAPQNTVANLCGSGCNECTVSQAPRVVGNEWSWTCRSINGASPQEKTCTAPIPAASCNNLSGEYNDPNSGPPESAACDPNNIFGANRPVLGGNGIWSWSCTYDGFAIPQTDGPCTAPTCLSRGPIDVQSNIYFSKSGESPQANVKINCANVCCEFQGTLVDSNKDPVTKVCHGETDKYLVVDHTGSYPAKCYFDNGGPDVPQSPTITTMCMERSCSAQGKCQATPKAAGGYGECKSTCNSDADCSTGRMIETRP